MGMTAPLQDSGAMIAPDAPGPAVARLLESLQAGDYSQEIVRRELQALVESAPEEAWELVSLMDQHYRRGEIRPADYRAVNSHLIALLLGSTPSAGQRAGQPHARDALRSPARAGLTEAIVPTGPVALTADIASVGAVPPTEAIAATAAVPPTEAIVPTGAIPRIAAIAPTEAPRLPAAASPPVPVAPVAALDAHARIGDEEPLVGRTLRGRYRILRVVGRGGLGTVFEAVDQFRIGAPADQRVALKVLHPAVSRRPEMLSALVREFQHVQLLSHPNIVRVHEFDRDGPITFFTMELLSGFTLDRLLMARRRTAFDRQHAFAIMRDIGAAIAHAHARGIVHGDINPHNVFVTDAGAVRILDFGSSAKARTEPWICDADSPERARFATLQYASCELLEGGVAEVRDDLFAFACVAYVLLTGRHPFGERTALQARAAGIGPRRPAGLAREQWRALREGLSLRRNRRPRDVEQWTRRLLADAPLRPLPRLPVLTSAPPGEPASRLRLAAGFAALLILAGGWWATRSKDPRLLAAAAALEGNATRLATGTGDRIAGAAHSASQEWLRYEAMVVAAVRRSALAARVEQPRPPVAAADPAKIVPAPASAAPAAAVPAVAPARRAARVRPASPKRRPAVAAAAGPARIELAANRVDVSPRDPVARVVVRRRGNLRAAVRFRWKVEPGTAHRDKDFAVFGPYVASIARGQRSTDLLIPIVSDPTRSRPVSFYVTIADAGPGTLIGPRTIAMVTIQPSR